MVFLTSSSDIIVIDANRLYTVVAIGPITPVVLKISGPRRCHMDVQFPLSVDHNDVSSHAHSWDSIFQMGIFCDLARMG